MEQDKSITPAQRLASIDHELNSPRFAYASMLTDQDKADLVDLKAAKKQLMAGGAGTSGAEIKDRSGKVWLYKGTAADPKTDRDPKNWVAK